MKRFLWFSLIAILLVGCTPVRPAYQFAKDPDPKVEKARALYEEIAKNIQSAKSIELTMTFAPEGFDQKPDIIKAQLLKPSYARIDSTYSRVVSDLDRRVTVYPGEKASMTESIIQNPDRPLQDLYGFEGFFSSTFEKPTGRPELVQLDGKEVLKATFSSEEQDKTVYYSCETKLPIQVVVKFGYGYRESEQTYKYTKVVLNPTLPLSLFDTNPSKFPKSELAADEKNSCQLGTVVPNLEFTLIGATKPTSLDELLKTNQRVLVAFFSFG